MANHKIHLLYVSAIIIVAVSAIGAFVYTNNKNNELQRTQIQQKAIEQQQKVDAEAKKKTELEGCLVYADLQHDEFWASEVKRLGRTDNTLPSDVAQNVDKYQKDLKEECYKKNS